MAGSILDDIQIQIRKRNYHFTLHANKRLIERHISISEVEEAILSANTEIIENYSKDPRGPSCLIFGMTGKGRPLHIQCSYPPDVAIITAYEPETTEWLNWRIRRERR